jgi:hypothetical protein
VRWQREFDVYSPETVLRLDGDPREGVIEHVQVARSREAKRGEHGGRFFDARAVQRRAERVSGQEVVETHPLKHEVAAFLAAAED